MHHRVRHFSGGNNHHAGHGAVQPVPGNTDSGHDDEQHGQDNDCGERSHMRHGVDRRRRVHCGEQTSRQKAANVAQLGGVLPSKQIRHPGRYLAGQLLRRAKRGPDVLAGRPKCVQQPQRLGPGFGVQQSES